MSIRDKKIDNAIIMGETIVTLNLCRPDDQTIRTAKYDIVIEEFLEKKKHILQNQARSSYQICDIKNKSIMVSGGHDLVCKCLKSVFIFELESG